MNERYTQTGLVIWISQLLKENRLHDFYICKPWRHLRAEVLKEQHFECQHCKAKGQYSPATSVHHKKKLKYYPALALTKSNLEALCEDCHYKADHPESATIKWDDEKF